MADTSGAQTHYLVTWHPRLNPANPRQFRVTIIEGYSTTDDIPKIIGIKNSIDPDDVVILKSEPCDQYGFPVGTRWVRVDAYDAHGTALGHAVADVLDAGTTAQANSNALGALVRRHQGRIANHRVSWGS